MYHQYNVNLGVQQNLELHVFKVPLCNLINFSLFQHVGGIFI